MRTWNRVQDKRAAPVFDILAEAADSSTIRALSHGTPLGGRAYELVSPPMLPAMRGNAALPAPASRGLLVAAMSWLVASFLDGCAAYGVAMHAGFVETRDDVEWGCLEHTRLRGGEQREIKPSRRTAGDSCPPENPARGRTL
jgi:hypothetical protein